MVVIPSSGLELPDLFGFISLPVRGGLGRAGVRAWRTGRGGTRLPIGSVKTGTDGIKGGTET